MFVVISPDEPEEYAFKWAEEARHKLVELVTTGNRAYMVKEKEYHMAKFTNNPGLSVS